MFFFMIAILMCLTNINFVCQLHLTIFTVGITPRLDRTGLHWPSLDLLDRENDVLVHLLVHGELASLAEGSLAARIVTLERLLLSVNIHMLFQVLCKSEGLKAENTDVLLDR